MKTLGFSSSRVLRMVLGESLLLSFFGAAMGALLAAGLLVLAAQAGGGNGPPIPFASTALLWSAVGALGLGIITGLAPALQAYRMRIIEALGRR